MKTWDYIARTAAMAILAIGFSTTAGAQQYEVVHDKKSTEMVAANMAAAMATETLHSAQIDSVKRRTLDIMSAVLIRQYMNDMDMAQRKDVSHFGPESRLYRKLVLECQRFVTETAMLCEVVSKNPVNTAYCYKHLAEISMLAKQEVKNAVIFGMDGKVPNPFKVNYDELLEGKVTVPLYIKDGDRDSVAFKTHNLLLPDERMTIVNNAIYKIRDYTRALRRVRTKIQYHTGFRQALRQTTPYVYRKVVATEMAVNNMIDNIERTCGLFK